MEQACRPESIVRIYIPFVTQGARWQYPRVSGELGSNRGIAPETHFAISGRNLNGLIERVSPRAVNFEKCPGQRILRTPAISRRTETRISPGAGPYRERRIDHRVYQGFLVAHQSSVRSVGTVNAVLPARFPERLIAAQEGQIHTGIPCSFYAGALGARPVFIVADGKKQLVVLDQCAGARGVNTGEISNVISIGFQPSHHGIFGIEDPRGRFKPPRV